MANRSQEVRFPLGENSDRMVTVSIFQSRLMLHIRQFYKDHYGELRAGKTGITLSVKEFDELVKLIPKLQQELMTMSFNLIHEDNLNLNVIKQDGCMESTTFV